MTYKAILRDSVILTDNYDDNELGSLVTNLEEDLRHLKVDYPVCVRNELDKKVLILFPALCDK